MSCLNTKCSPNDCRCNLAADFTDNDIAELRNHIPSMGSDTNTSYNQTSEYLTYLQNIADQDVNELRKKDKEYGGSWKRRGGVGAYMMAARKIDRIEESMKKGRYDIFYVIENDFRDEGIIDDIRDLRRYLILIEAEMIARGVLK